MIFIHRLDLWGMGFGFREEKYSSFQVVLRENCFLAFNFKVLFFTKCF